MGVYDQAQSQRVAQRTGIEQPGIRLVYLEDLPEIAYRGQLIYNGTSDFLLIYDGVAWQTIGDQSSNRLFVQSADPQVTPSNAVTEGDQWYSPTTGLLVVWDGTMWAEPAIPEDAVGEAQIADEAITSKHTIQGARIIGTNFFTADPDVAETYMQIVQDANGGNIYFNYGIGETFNGFLNPKADGSRPMVQLSSGNMSPSAGGSAQLKLYGAFSGGAGKKAEFNCDLYMNGDLVSTSSRRYKENIELIPYVAKDLLQLEPKVFNRIGEVKQEVGFIAEEAEELGLEAWVFRDPETDSVEAFSYVNWVVALQQICREQQDQIDRMEDRLAALEARLED